MINYMSLKEKQFSDVELKLNLMSPRTVFYGWTILVVILRRKGNEKLRKHTETVIRNDPIF